MDGWMGGLIDVFAPTLAIFQLYRGVVWRKKEIKLYKCYVTRVIRPAL